MTSNKELAKQLEDSLGLETPPVALRFVQEPPQDLPRFEGEVPSACSFWRRAEKGAFYADTPAHLNCLIGTHTMGLPMPADKGPELMALIGQMGEADAIHQQFALIARHGLLEDGGRFLLQGHPAVSGR